MSSPRLGSPRAGHPDHTTVAEPLSVTLSPAVSSLLGCVVVEGMTSASGRSLHLLSEPPGETDHDTETHVGPGGEQGLI